MATSSSKLAFKQIIEWVRNDIEKNGFVGGMKYKTAQEIADQLAIHPRTASRALSELAKKGVLVRRRHVGTFIGDSRSAHRTRQTPCVHIFVSPDWNKIFLPTGELIEGIMEGLKIGCSQLNLLPVKDQKSYMLDALESARANHSAIGIVLIRCLREIQELVQESGEPCVIFGSNYSTTSDMPSVDMDQFQVGVQLTRYLLTRGVSRIALMTREHWLPGDNLFHDGIVHALSCVKGVTPQLSIRSLPMNADLCVHEMSRLFEQELAPNGIICRDAFYAECALRTAESFLLKIPRDLEIVFNHWCRNKEHLLPHTFPQMGYRNQSVLVGKMLALLLDGQVPNPRHLKIPVNPVVSNY